MARSTRMTLSGSGGGDSPLLARRANSSVDADNPEQSFGQPCLAQAACPSFEIFLSPDRDQIPYISNPQPRVDLPHLAHGFLRLDRLPGKRAAGGGNAGSEK